MKLITCEFNMDSGCVEMRFNDGTMMNIDYTVVENEYAHTVRQKTELDWLVYNAPLEYAQLVLSRAAHEYLLAITKSQYTIMERAMDAMRVPWLLFYYSRLTVTYQQDRRIPAAFTTRLHPYHLRFTSYGAILKAR